MKTFISILFIIFFSTVSFAYCTGICDKKPHIPVVVKLNLQDLVLINAEKYLYVRELTNNNDSPEIDMFLAYLGLPKYLSWCAAYVVYVHKEASDSIQIKNPLPRYGRVSALWEITQENELRFKTFDAEDVFSGEVKLQKSDIIIWESNNLAKVKNFNGHTGLVRYQIDNDKFASIEGNTTPGDKGNQREGGGVYERNRKLAIGASFQVLGFIRIK